jgi:phage gp36-like protein
MAYTPIIIPADLKTNIYTEITAEITRGDDTIPTQAIAEGIEEVKAYLSRYDLVALFGDAVAGTSATTHSEFLKALVKSVASWKLINLANPNINDDNMRTRYEDAIKTLTRISEGKMTPQGWPYYVPPSPDPVPGSAVQWSGATKRNTHL